MLLLSFHNATYVTSYTPDSPPEDLTRACSTAASLLIKKLVVGLWGEGQEAMICLEVSGCGGSLWC
jgi:hypothetical protein